MSHVDPVVKLELKRRRVQGLQVVLVACLLLMSLFFNVLGYLTVAQQNAEIKKRAAENHQSLQILKDATGPAATKAAAHSLACSLNHIDVELGKAPADPTCVAPGAPGTP